MDVPEFLDLRVVNHKAMGTNLNTTVLFHMKIRRSG